MMHLLTKHDWETLDMGGYPMLTLDKQLNLGNVEHRPTYAVDRLSAGLSMWLLRRERMTVSMSREKQWAFEIRGSGPLVFEVLASNIVLVHLSGY